MLRCNNSFCNATSDADNGFQGSTVLPVKERKMEIVTVVLQLAGVATVAYGLVLAARNGLGHALVPRAVHHA
jgi:hypothetical protein